MTIPLPIAVILWVVLLPYVLLLVAAECFPRLRR